MMGNCSEKPPFMPMEAYPYLWYLFIFAHSARGELQLDKPIQFLLAANSAPFRERGRLGFDVFCRLRHHAKPTTTSGSD